MRELTQDAMEAGAAGVMIAPPNTLRTGRLDRRVLQGRRRRRSAPTSVRHPGLSAHVLGADDAGVIRRIAQDNPSCVMLKHEDWPGLEKISQLATWEREGAMRHLAILTGNNALFLDFEMDRGADGANTGYCFPDMLVDVVRPVGEGKRDEAHDLFDAHLPLIRYEQQPGPGLAVRKYVLMRRGIIASDTMRARARL
jgi:4-hydroxy-tetrahydrodipicolinate synthase